MVDLTKYLLPNSSSVKFIIILILVIIVLSLSIKDLAASQNQQINLQPNCRKLDIFRKHRNYPYVALASYMGSGNTWMRHLLQLYSGISTSSLYHDGEISLNSDLSRKAKLISNPVCVNRPGSSRFMGYGFQK